MQPRRERPVGWGIRPEGGQDDGASDDPEHVEPRQRLGEWLRETRLRKGLTFAEIEQTTRINRHYLEALEAEHFDVLPAPVYARGFLRSYARMLGLDPEQAIALMPADLPRPPGLDPLPGLRRAASDAPAIPFPSLPSIPIAPRAVAILAGGVLLLLAIVLLLPAVGGGDAPGVPVPGAPGALMSVPPFEQGKAPNFVGVHREVAQEVLQSLGVLFVTVEVPSEAPAGTVVGQTPQPGAALEAGDNATLVLSRGPLR